MHFQVVASTAGWNIGGVDEKGISAAANWKAGGPKPPSGKIGALGVVVSGCRGPAVRKKLNYFLGILNELKRIMWI
jgi:hypothetical protein